LSNEDLNQNASLSYKFLKQNMSTYK